MAKKRLMGLGPVLVVAALAVMPAVAQAVPHYYKNGVLIPEGEKVPLLEWGKLTLQAEPSLAAVTTCDNSAGGYLENPVGGGAGAGRTLRFATWNCNNAECPSGEIEIKGQKYEKEFEVLWPPQDFPWPSVLEEPEPQVVRTNSTGVVMKLACMAHGLTRAAAGEGGAKGAGENEQYVLATGGPATVTCVTDETHKLEPQDEKGSNLGPNQSKVVYNTGAGSLNCAHEAFHGKLKEGLRIMGFKASELITVH
jgi:hypothetical protein